MNDARNILPGWEFIADSVMGGVSTGSLTAAPRAGRRAHRLRGEVSREAGGGFIQMAFDLNSDGAPYDASRWAGIELDVLGNDEAYDVRLRTCQLTKPWHSYRATFQADATWKTLRIPFDGLDPHRHEIPFDAAQLCRIGVLAIGREFHADIAVSALRFFA